MPTKSVPKSGELCCFQPSGVIVAPHLTCYLRGEHVSDRVFRNFINGKSVDSADGQMMDLINPTTGEVFAQAAKSSAQDIDRALAAASTAFETWKDSTPSERSLALLKIADAIEANADELVALES